MKYRSTQSDDSEGPAPPESSDRLTRVEPDSPDGTASAVARAANIFWATMAGALTIAVLLMFSSGIDRPGFAALPGAGGQWTAGGCGKYG